MRLCVSLVSLVVLAALLPISAAVAGDRDDPEVTDPCGLAAVEEGVAQPGLDICAAWFTTHVGGGGPAAVEVTVAFAQDFAKRAAGSTVYSSYLAEGCDVALRYDDEDGEAITGGSATFDAASARVQVRHRCGEASSFTDVDVAPETVSVAGPLLTFGLVLDGDLSPLASAHRVGATLTDLSVTATSPQGVYFGYACVGQDGNEPLSLQNGCAHLVTDTTFGSEDHVIEQDDGPHAVTPAIPANCVAGTVADSSAAAPALVDPAHDHAGLRSAYPDSRYEAFDVRSGWWGETADGGVTFTILPAGPLHTAGDLRYLLDFNLTHAEIGPDGSGGWTALFFTDSDEAVHTHVDPIEAPVARDADSGAVTVTIPEAHLPEVGGELVLDYVYSHWRWYGRAGGDPRHHGSSGVDSTQGNGQACTVIR